MTPAEIHAWETLGKLDAHVDFMDDLLQDGANNPEVTDDEWLWVLAERNYVDRVAGVLRSEIGVS